MRAASLLLLLAAAPALAQECPLTGQSPKLEVQLFFSGASPAAWARFLRDELTPAFPDGFTVYQAYGQWKDPKTHRISRERTEVVMIAAADGPAFRSRITALAERYTRRFHQQSVGLLTNPSCGAF